MLGLGGFSQSSLTSPPICLIESEPSISCQALYFHPHPTPTKPITSLLAQVPLKPVQLDTLSIGEDYTKVGPGKPALTLSTLSRRGTVCIAQGVSGPKPNLIKILPRFTGRG